MSAREKAIEVLIENAEARARAEAQATLVAGPQEITGQLMARARAAVDSDLRALEAAGLRLIPADAVVIKWRTDIENAPEGETVLAILSEGAVILARRHEDSSGEEHWTECPDDGGRTCWFDGDIAAWSELPAGPTLAALETEGEE